LKSLQKVFQNAMLSDESEINQPLLKSNMHSPVANQDRTIDLFENDDLNDHKKHKISYAKNVIVTSRYTIFSFLPKSLFEQFRRLANVYFLVLGIIAAIGAYTNVYETAIQPAGILAPMIIVVMISVIKDGIEDLKRHSADSRINLKLARKVSKTDGKIETKTWKELKVGDIILIFGDDEIPADTVVLSCGGVQGESCFVETAAIDGETNLKLKMPCYISKQKTKSLNSSAVDSSELCSKSLITINEAKDTVYGLYETSLFEFFFFFFFFF
jgi:magnesium-transporting ATPase (P-type)